MISLTRLSGSQFVLNCDLVERLDETPDTVITLADGTKYVVVDSMRSIVAKIRLHRAEIIALSELVHVQARDPDQDLEAPAARRVAAPHLVVAADPVAEGGRS